MKLEESAKSWDTKLKQTTEEKEREVTSIVIAVIGLSNHGRSDRGGMGGRSTLGQHPLYQQCISGPGWCRHVDVSICQCGGALYGVRHRLWFVYRYVVISLYCLKTLSCKQLGCTGISEKFVN